MMLFCCWQLHADDIDLFLSLLRAAAAAAAKNYNQMLLQSV